MKNQSVLPPPWAGSCNLMGSLRTEAALFISILRRVNKLELHNLIELWEITLVDLSTVAID